MRFVLTHPAETRPSLVVVTCNRIDDQEVDRLREDMFGAGCANGLLFDDEQCIILRDTFSSMSRDSIERDGKPIPTDTVLSTVSAGPLDSRVGRWLELLSENGNRAIPLDPAAATPFIADVVPAASGSLVVSTPTPNR